MPVIERYRQKIYIRIPGGEIQIGLVSRSICVWFRCKPYFIKRTNWAAAERTLARRGTR